MPCPYPKEHCRETALPSPTYHSGAAGFEIVPKFSSELLATKMRRRQCRVPTQKNIVGKRHCRILCIIPVQPELI